MDRIDWYYIYSPRYYPYDDNMTTFSIYHLLSGSNDRIEDLKEKLVQAKILLNDFEKYYTLSLEKYGANFM